MSVAENSVILVGLNIVGTNLYEAIVLRYIPVRLWSTCLRRFILKSPARKTLLVDLETFDNIPSKSDTKSCIERPWRSIDYTNYNILVTLLGQFYEKTFKCTQFRFRPIASQTLKLNI